MEKHIGIYARVSSKRQDLRSQLPDLEQWQRAHENGVPIVWYKHKVTGKTMDRPGWNRLESGISSGRVTAVVVWRLDRLGRTASGLTALFDKLVARNVNLVSLKDGVDLSTPAGRLIANVLASVAAYERETIVERIVAGQSAARAQGKRWGGSEKGRRIKVNDEQIATIRRMHLEDGKVAAMARATGLSRPTVYSVLDSFNGDYSTDGRGR